ncbi:MAG: Mur ligase family protein [Spirochaetes bacterium]|jgi:dihydrofolate synthase/folylpolyglutamate synthase|nr:Mur ligase family protein [Spirochaetota bacterium]
MQSPTRRLEELVNNEKTGHLAFSNYSLKHIKNLLKYYGNPHRKINTIHVAGTNGKGSTCHMLAAIFIEAGYSTGLYTSPHLLRVNERIKINGKEIIDKKLKEYSDELVDLLDKKKDLRPSYFDALTLFAFRFFCEMKADISIIEVGLGGRRDSTNLIRPLVSVITDISMDHRNILGNTIKKIASEKAGIIKPRVPVVTMNTKKDIIDFLKKAAGKKSAKIYALKSDFKTGNIIFNRDDGTTAFDLTISKPPGKENIIIKNILLRQTGAFQVKNASTAITASMLLNRKGFQIGENHIKKALKRVGVPGRMQVINKKPLIIFDPAHNPQALRETIHALKDLYPGMPCKIAASFMKDKEYNIMFKIIRKELTGDIYYYELDDERCLKSDGYNILKSMKTYRNADDLYSALEAGNGGSLIFITGSFRLFGLSRVLAAKFKKDRDAR